MEITYKNTWDEIQKALIDYSAATHERFFKIARSAFEIKSAIESIEQQKKLAELQNLILAQQNNVVSQTKKLMYTTIVLAIFTGLLFGSTTCSAIFAYKTYKTSGEQITAINDLEKTLGEVETALSKVSKSIRLLPSIEKRLKERPSRSSRQQTGTGIKR